MKRMKLVGSSIFMALGITIAHAQNQTVDTCNHSIEVGYKRTTMLVFPRPIDKTDCGSADLMVKPNKKEGYVLKVKASTPDFEPTNLTVFTKDGWMYSLRVSYRAKPTQLVYDFGGEDSLCALKKLHDKSMNIVRIGQYAQLIGQLPLHSRNYKIKVGNVKMDFQRVFIKEDILFFVFHINNRSSIPYDLQLGRFYIKDRQQRKRSSQMEQEITPLYQFMTTEQRVNAKGYVSFVIACNKFTISDHKYFIVELSEKNGDRKLQMRLSGKVLLHAGQF